MVNDGEDGIVPFTIGEVSDEVHGDRLEGQGLWVSGDAVGWGFRGVRARFVLLAGHTAFDILFHPMLQVGPPESFFEACNSP